MHRVWGFLSDPGLHLLALALVLVVLTIGSIGTEEPEEPGHSTSLVFCKRCEVSHTLERAGSRIKHTRIVQVQP